jgi:peptidoglycan-N-acetylglucosamine deacetylase
MRKSLSTLLVLVAGACAAHAGEATKAAAAPAAKPAPAAAATETSALPTPAPKAGCANPNALGVARTVEIDTKGGPGFGFEHYKAYDFLQDKEVVLTFDDGPQVRTTKAILDALDEQCTKAIFFSLGKMALGLPEIIRDVAHRGHTVGTHTWSHQDMRKKTDQEAKDEIEKGISGVRRAVGGPISPFFRYPYLRDSAATLAHLQSRNIAMFSTDVDSFDFKRQTPEQLVTATMARLDKKGKGVLLMHDIQPHTAKAMPALLAALKAGGYKVVHMKAKDEQKTLAEYDAMIEKDVKGLPTAGTERPLSSVVKTVPSP